MTNRIAVIKTGWSDDFTGSEVEADHKHVRTFKDGSEKFNFLPAPDGRFYAYTPPLGRAAPKPKQLEDWLVFSVAKKPRMPGLYLTGWYESATFAGAFVPRPEYKLAGSALPHDETGEPYYYVLSASQAVHLDPTVERHVFRGEHMKRTSIVYLRGNGMTAPWRESLARRLLKIRDGRHKAQRQSPVIGSGTGGICADAERRKEVEKAAVAVVKKHYLSARYKVDDRQQQKCGFDLLVRAPKFGRELHVEVKGTQNNAPHFLMSHKEYAYMCAQPRRWRLAMVTEALSKSPRLEIMDANEAGKRFLWKEFTWHAVCR